MNFSIQKAKLKFGAQLKSNIFIPFIHIINEVKNSYPVSLSWQLYFDLKKEWLGKKNNMIYLI